MKSWIPEFIKLEVESKIENKVKVFFGGDNLPYFS